MSHKQELEAELSEKAAERHLWKTLLEHPAWATLKAAGDEQRALRFATLEQPLSGFSQTLAQEFLKGEASGVGLILTMPEAQLDLLELDIKRLTESIELENDNVSEEAAATPRSRVDDDDFSGGDATYP